MGVSFSMEKKPLLKSEDDKCSSNSDTDQENLAPQKDEGSQTKGVHLEKPVTLLHAVGVIIGTVIGSGIFISSRGVTENAGSVGAALVVWAATGVYMLLQAWCYAELGTAIPVSGGDYSFNYFIWGGLPAFSVAWIHVLLITPSAMGAVSQTAAQYITVAFGIGNIQWIKTVIALSIILLFAAINLLSTKLATRLNTVLTASKVTALLFLITVGIVQLTTGRTQNFNNAFEGTSTDVGNLAEAVIDAYFAYKGWEQIAALPEEMKNPKRDLPLALVISVSAIATIYLMTNVAYFTVLTPAEVIASGAVAITFVKRVFGDKLVWLIALCVSLSCMGTINAHTLTDSRYPFAVARNGQLPRCFSMIHQNTHTPIPALIFMVSLFVLFTCIPSVETLIFYSALSLQVKLIITISGLLYLKWKRPDLERPVSVPALVAVLAIVTILIMLGLNLYNTPRKTFLGLALCGLSVPVYGIVHLLRERQYSLKCCDGTPVGTAPGNAQKVVAMGGAADFIAGLIGGGAGLVVGHPFDTVKVTQQVSRGSGDQGVLVSMLRTVRADGLRHGLFKGMAFPLISIGIQNSIYFGTYGMMKRELERTVQPEGTGFSRYGCIAGAAAFAGFVQAIPACPFELVKVNLQAQTARARYSGPIDCVLKMYRAQGLRGLFIGLNATITREIPGLSVYMTSYEIMLDYNRNDVTGKVPLARELVISGMAGVFSWIVNTPTDIVKSQIQSDNPKSPKYKGFFHCAQSLYREQGIRVFGRGFPVICMRAFPVNVVTLMVYTRILKHLQGDNCSSD